MSLTPSFQLGYRDPSFFYDFSPSPFEQQKWGTGRKLCGEQTAQRDPIPRRLVSPTSADAASGANRSQPRSPCSDAQPHGRREETLWPEQPPPPVAGSNCSHSAFCTRPGPQALIEFLN